MGFPFKRKARRFTRRRTTAHEIIRRLFRNERYGINKFMLPQIRRLSTIPTVPRAAGGIFSSASERLFYTMDESRHFEGESTLRSSAPRPAPLSANSDLENIPSKKAYRNNAPSEASTTRKILGFNGLRGFAVCCVFVQHKAKIDLVDVGWLGVWLFFALSGFLIIGILHRTADRREAGLISRRTAITRFFAHRTLRIFPIYYLTLAVCALIYGVAVHIGNEKVASIFIGGWRGLGLHALYLSNLFTAFRHDGYLGIMAHLWTLSIEEQFYLIIAPLLLIVAARHHIGICAAGLGIAAVTQYGLVLAGMDDVFVRTFSINDFGVMFAGGLCVLASSALRRKFAGSKTLLLVPAAILFLSISRGVWAPAMPAVASATLDVAMMACAAFVILWIAENQESTLVRILEIRPIEYLGRISYGFYLYHMFIPNLGNGGKVAAALHLPAQSLAVKAAGFVLSFAVSVLVAHLSWRYIEQPILRFKK